MSNLGEVKVYKIITPKIVAEAKKHFNCDTINGVYLENEGGGGTAGAHLEKLLYSNSVMSGASTGHSVLSRFELAFMEDSGWYQVDYTYG